MAAFSPKSSAALVRERDLEFRVRQLLIQREGFKDPTMWRVEQEPDQVCALFTVESLTGPLSCTAFIYADGSIDVVRGTFTF